MDPVLVALVAVIVVVIIIVIVRIRNSTAAAAEDPLPPLPPTPAPVPIPPTPPSTDPVQTPGKQIPQPGKNSSAPPAPTLPPEINPAGPSCPSYPELSEGVVFRCPNNGAIMRVENCTKRWFPNPPIYAEYGSPPPTVTGCFPNMPYGRDYSPKTAPTTCNLPAGIHEGSIVQCPVTGAIFKIENCTKRWYPNPDVWMRHGSPQPVAANCLEFVPYGDDMI